MGFFKKLGTAVKKGLKQVSLKNVVKLGTPLLGAIPILGGGVQQLVSGASEAHELKKQSQRLAEQGKIEEANALAIQSEQMAQTNGAYLGQQVGAQFNAFTKGATDEMIAQVSNGTKQVVGSAGANVVDLTIQEWLKKHFTKILLVAGALIGGIWYFKGRNTPRKSTYRRR